MAWPSGPRAAILYDDWLHFIAAHRAQWDVSPAWCASLYLPSRQPPAQRIIPPMQQPLPQRRSKCRIVDPSPLLSAQIYQHRDMAPVIPPPRNLPCIISAPSPQIIPAVPLKPSSGSDSRIHPFSTHCLYVNPDLTLNRLSDVSYRSYGKSCSTPFRHSAGSSSQSSGRRAKYVPPNTPIFNIRFGDTSGLNPTSYPFPSHPA